MIPIRRYIHNEVGTLGLWREGARYRIANPRWIRREEDTDDDSYSAFSTSNLLLSGRRMCMGLLGALGQALASESYKP